jgi:hypothetical protein
MLNCPEHEDDMGIDIVVTRNVFEPIPDGASWFGLRNATARALSQQPESTLSHGIDAVATTVFNRNQIARLLQEFRMLAQHADEVTRQNLEDAADFIERGMELVGPGGDCYMAFVGD